MKAVFNVFADPCNSNYKGYLFILHDVLKAKEQVIVMDDTPFTIFDKY